MEELYYTIDLDIDDEFAPWVVADDLKAAVAGALRYTTVGAASVTLVITGDATVQQLNRDFRGVDAPTDVLSFAAHEEAEGTPNFVLPPELAPEMASYLGDIVIAYPYAARQAERFGNSVTSELRLLAVHGVLHLIGYDHATAEEEDAMWAVQEEVLTTFGDGQLARRTYDM